MFVTPLLLLLLASGASAVKVVRWCSEVPPQPGVFGNNQPLIQLYECEFLSPLHIPFLWSPVKMQVVCPSVRYKVYVGESQHSLVDKVNRKEDAWCGLRSLVWDGRMCDLQVSPFHTHYIGIKTSHECSLETQAVFSYAMFSCLVVGALLYSSADGLSSSALFRISCGALAFIAGSLFILLFVLVKSVPFKRAITITVLVLGSSGLAALTWATGRWMPSLDQLVHNPWVMGYVLVSGAMGAAVTYYYDDRDNPKLNTLIKVTLSLGGLALVYCGTWTFFPLTAATISLLLASSFSPEMAETVQQHVSPFMTPLVTPFTTPLVSNQRTQDSPSSRPQRPQRGGSPEFSFSQLRNQLLGVAQRSPASTSTSPLHLRNPPPKPPPRPWPSDDSYVKSFDEKMAEHKQRHHRSSLPANTVAPVGGSAVEAGNKQGGEDSPGVCDRVLNESTGRMVKVGGALYKQLVSQGHILNLEKGVISPPSSPPARTSGASKIPSIAGKALGKP